MPLDFPSAYDLDSSMTSGDFTYSYGKFSCMREMFIAHQFCAYMLCVLGPLAFISRLVPSLNRFHKIIGRAYILFMLWGTATAMLITNTGLPTAVLSSVSIILGGLTIGWIVINFHQHNLHNQALSNLNEEIKETGKLPNGSDLAAAIKAEKANIAAKKVWWRRVFSWKTLHGSLFFASWYGCAARAFVTPVDYGFVCYTYPYYKVLNETRPCKNCGGYENITEPTPVPVQDPRDMSDLPWNKTGDLGWWLLMGPGLVACGFVFASVYTFTASKLCSSSRKSSDFYSVPSDGSNKDMPSAIPLDDQASS